MVQKLLMSGPMRPDVLIHWTVLIWLGAIVMGAAVPLSAQSPVELSEKITVIPQNVYRNLDWSDTLMAIKEWAKEQGIEVSKADDPWLLTVLSSAVLGFSMRETIGNSYRLIIPSTERKKDKLALQDSVATKQYLEGLHRVLKEKIRDNLPSIDEISLSKNNQIKNYRSCDRSFKLLSLARISVGGLGLGLGSVGLVSAHSLGKKTTGKSIRDIKLERDAKELHVPLSELQKRELKEAEKAEANALSSMIEPRLPGLIHVFRQNGPATQANLERASVAADRGKYNDNTDQVRAALAILRKENEPKMKQILTDALLSTIVDAAKKEGKKPSEVFASMISPEKDSKTLLEYRKFRQDVVEEMIHRLYIDIVPRHKVSFYLKAATIKNLEAEVEKSLIEQEPH